MTDFYITSTLGVCNLYTGLLLAFVLSHRPLILLEHPFNNESVLIGNKS